jgi:hypothetical protein
LETEYVRDIDPAMKDKNKQQAGGDFNEIVNKSFF